MIEEKARHRYVSIAREIGDTFTKNGGNGGGGKRGGQGTHQRRTFNAAILHSHCRIAIYCFFGHFYIPTGSIKIENKKRQFMVRSQSTCIGVTDSNRKWNEKTLISSVDILVCAFCWHVNADQKQLTYGGISKSLIFEREAPTIQLLKIQ